MSALRVFMLTLGAGMLPLGVYAVARGGADALGYFSVVSYALVVGLIVGGFLLVRAALREPSR